MAHVDAARRLPEVLVAPEISVAGALALLDRAGTGMLLVANEDRRLLGLLSDGDLRRAILSGRTLDTPCVEFAMRTPLVVGPDATDAEALELMDVGRPYVINHLPVVNPDGGIVGLLLRSDLVSTGSPRLSAVIMAGGYGLRLRPLTDQTPKPMLPVGDRPLLELTIARLRAAGVRHVSIATHYLSECITRHFGDGSAFGVEVSYLTEERPLGTAGALRALRDAQDTFVVLNGDVLTGVPFERMLSFHRHHRADMTVGVRDHAIEVPYGVVECDDVHVLRVREKPTQHFLVNAGIYVLEPSVPRLLPDDLRIDMPELIQRLVEAGRTVVSFPIVEYWLDIGRPADYERAQAEVRQVAP